MVGLGSAICDTSDGGAGMKVVMRAVFSGPADRSQADDADDWRETKQEREEVMYEVSNKLRSKGLKVKAKVSADILTVTIISKKDLSKSEINKIAEKISKIGDYTFAPDPIEIDIK